MAAINKQAEEIFDLFNKEGTERGFLEGLQMAARWLAFAEEARSPGPLRNRFVSLCIAQDHCRRWPDLNLEQHLWKLAGKVLVRVNKQLDVPLTQQCVWGYLRELGTSLPTENIYGYLGKRYVWKHRRKRSARPAGGATPK
jgi:hypothetical protein